MVKYDSDGSSFKYHNENNEQEFIDIPTYDKAAEIICDLMTCKEFQCDSTILNSLYMAMRKLQGYSDKDIQKLMR